MTKPAKYNPLLSLARQAKLRHMEMQCDPQWALDLTAERDELRIALAATDKLASEAAQRNEELHRDAMRYRYLRDECSRGWDAQGRNMEILMDSPSLDSCRDIDALIDAALSQQAKP